VKRPTPPFRFSIALERACERAETALGDGGVAHLPGRAQDTAHARSHIVRATLMGRLVPAS